MGSIELLGFGLTFADLDTNRNGVLDNPDLNVSISGADTTIDLSSRFGNALGTDTITVASVTGLDSNDVLFFF